MTQKHELRAAARANRLLLAAARPNFAATIAHFAPLLAARGTLAFYWPLEGEADPRALAEALAERGHDLALPCVTAKDAPLLFRHWLKGDALRTCPFGLQEPLPDRPVCIPAVLLVPLLGYGGGFYDRTLAQLRSAGPVQAVGIAYAGQAMDVLPREPHDQPLNLVVTEDGVRQFRR
jgi:5-formyltetrahydrofolate cyclo-ligase